MTKRAWTRTDKLTVATLVLAALAIIGAFVIPEGRRLVGLDKPAPEPTSNNSSPEPSSTPTIIVQKTTPRTKGNTNVAGNNVSGNNNIVGNENQTAPTAIAPNGIAISGGNVNNPTVNNFGKPSSSRHLTESQKATLIASLKRIDPKSFYFLSAPDAESTHFGNEVLKVLVSPELGWKMLDLPPNWGQAYRQADGLYIVVSDLQKPPPGAVELQQAFKGIGVDASGMTYPMVGPDKFAIYVGVNPASE